MKILYAIQGTGNGHLSRAKEIIPLLQQKGDVDILVSGTQGDLSLEVPVKYKLKGLGFVFGKKGGVDLLRTYRESDLRGFIKDAKCLPVETYDLIINDFEPVSAWAAFFRNIPCIALSHQCAVVSPSAPVAPKKDLFGKRILRHYAPSTAQYGFHFSPFDEHTYTPVIRKEVRKLKVTDQGHYTVYLPAYGDNKLIDFLTRFKKIRWQVFSKHCKGHVFYKNVTIIPIENDAFLRSMASCSGILCGAGFETPAEALYLGKKLMVVPMKHQYEQHCNAAALESLGVPALKNLKDTQSPLVEEWIQSDRVIQVDYPDLTEKIINRIIEEHLYDVHHSRSLQSFFGYANAKIK